MRWQRLTETNENLPSVFSKSEKKKSTGPEDRGDSERWEFQVDRTIREKRSDPRWFVRNDQQVEIGLTENRCCCRSADEWKLQSAVAQDSLQLIKLLIPSCPKWRSNRLGDLARRGGGRVSQAESWQTKQNKHQSSWNFKYAQAGEIIVLGSFVSTFNRNSYKRDRHCSVFGYVGDVKWKQHRFHKINIAATAKQNFRPVFSDCHYVGLSFYANPVYILGIFFQGKLW